MISECGQGEGSIEPDGNLSSPDLTEVKSTEVTTQFDQTKVEPEGGTTKVMTKEERRIKLLQELDLSGADEWSDEDRKDAVDLMLDFDEIFALHDLELGKTSLVQHNIELTNYKPFKDRFRRIPPYQYEEVKKHLKQMMEVGAIRKSNSPWASAAVLVHKKDGTLRFCIDLCKLNARTIKDAYSLPRIEESLDCLSGAQWFTSLDLKSGYWQVELTEEAKALTE